MRTLKGVKIGSGKNHITSTQFVTISQNVHEYFLWKKLNKEQVKWNLPQVDTFIMESSGS